VIRALLDAGAKAAGAHVDRRAGRSTSQRKPATVVGVQALARARRRT
jgi:hypothetical protein